MKLRNKKTGEIVEPRKIGFEIYSFNERLYNSLAELNKEWEDVLEEPKEHWYIDWDGKLMVSTDEEGWEAAISTGNYFETKEEAEKAVERLRAWKRLKDKGFEFINFPYKKICKYDARTGVGNLEYQVKYYEELEPDLDLLFGGEE